MSKITIIPPERNSVATNATPYSSNLPGIRPAGVLNSMLARREAVRQQRVFQALTARTNAEVQLLNAHTTALDAYAKRDRAAAALAELPEIIADERTRRRTARAEELRELRHRHDLASKRREMERLQAETLLVEAQQALRAQQTFGYAAHELAWKQKQTAMLDLDVDAAERQHLLAEHRRTTKYPAIAHETRDDIDAALLEARAELRASGLNTAKLDALIAARHGVRQT